MGGVIELRKGVRISQFLSFQNPGTDNLTIHDDSTTCIPIIGGTGFSGLE